MTRDEVMALSDEELRIKAAELLGARWYLFDGTSDPKVRVLEFSGMWFPGHAPGFAIGVEPMSDTALRNIPDYPHDIAAAWELFELLPLPCGIERGCEKVWGVGPIGTHVGFGALPLDRRDGDYDEDDIYAERVWGDTAPLAITRAFVLAMTGGPDARP